MTDAYLNSDWNELQATKPSKLIYVSMADAVFPPAVKLRWSGRLPQGTCTLLAGDGGIGKSTLTALIAACLSLGEPLPGEEEGEEPMATAVIAFEDNFEDFWLPRFRAHNGDENLLTKIILPPDEVFTVYDIDDLKRRTGYGFIVLDPVAEVVTNSGLDLNSAEGAKAVMSRMRDVGQATGASALALAHFGKATDRSLGNQISGSAQWRQSARSVLVFGELEDGTLGLIHDKANNTRPQLPLEFAMEETVAELKGDTRETAVLRSKGPNPDLTHFYKKVAAPNEDDGSKKKHVYAAWLVKKLDRCTGHCGKAKDLEALFIMEHKGFSAEIFQVGVRCAKDQGIVYSYTNGDNDVVLTLRRPQSPILVNEDGELPLDKS